ncbi:hypothetical protein H2200_013412 [Cladophialophora chaetospira]|uniref:Peptidase S33 tripeptidyl aminopeptidase-like C-terminal domain-containing protein n=1 Tax=Cladophialophora chaetospira TaxID=386627 RepID=A0AA38WQ03_9EURO|nr:hypothetical protein H2200_013412 [Cladophialophora chaetospira]
MTGSLTYQMGTDQAGSPTGMQIGSEYAEKFPDKVGRMVLDGPYDRHLSLETSLSTAAVGVESTLNDFFRWCNTTTDCVLHGRDQAAIWDALGASSDAGTLYGQSCGGPCLDNGLVPPWLLRGTLNALLHDYNDRTKNHNWYRFAEALEAAFDTGNASYFTDPVATMKSSSIDWVIYSQYIVFCSDRDTRQLKFEDLRTIYTLTSVLAPHTLGYSLAQQTVLAREVHESPHNLDPHRMSQLPPIMLVNAFYDPATLSPWGLDMRSQIPTAFSIYRNGGGHTSWSFGGDTNKVINAFLVNGTIPADGTIYQS